MTRKEALAEAKRRWGQDAWVETYRPVVAQYGFAPPKMFKVYRVKVHEEPMGHGPSWEDAFAEADKRAEFRKMNDIGNAHFRIGPGRMV